MEEVEEKKNTLFSNNDGFLFALMFIRLVGKFFFFLLLLVVRLSFCYWVLFGFLPRVFLIRVLSMSTSCTFESKSLFLFWLLCFFSLLLLFGTSVFLGTSRISLVRCARKNPKPQSP